MSRSSALDTLIELTREAVDNAGRQLAGARRSQQQAQGQLDTLQHYRQEYARGLQQAMQEGMEPASLLNYQAFLGTLDNAIDRARLSLNEQQRQVSQRQQQWLEQQRKLNSYHTLVDRRAQAEQLRDSRSQQRITDELSAQLRLRGSAFTSTSGSGR
ncbi:Flagellar protein fliJ [Pseudomonas sp. OF001]|jgi:flagellar FliJ protein|uniref:flagellar export protein FliJ n=1 Tax=unclassified Pseudomonas TaxID=196821 RepID=UPI0010A637D4|nr:MULTISPECIES: flagellar export protein FliJ [unclassified Pseudomonas]THG74612.1 flagellar export protein FliJ [Pseudomonas sp. A-1]WPP46865.1 flagellar export protein FliJ [Pseudomonas sp. AN-1]CAD5379330.1 Flagellar protein fliJ [Pseudomonas sp. OF001]